MVREEGGTPLLSAGALRRSPSCMLADESTPEQSQEASQVQRKLIAALVLAVLFMVVEVAGGIIANSLAILTDAAHLLSDVSGFAVAIFAGVVAAKKSSSTHTFGYHRIEVLGALASVLSTWLVTGILVVEAIDRIQHPMAVNGKLMFFLALGGVAINVVIFLILGEHGHSHAGHSHSHAHGHDHDGHSHAHAAHGHSHGHAHGGRSQSDGAAAHAHGGNGYQHAHAAEHGSDAERQAAHEHAHGGGCEGHAHGAAGDVEAGLESDSASTPAAAKVTNINLRRGPPLGPGPWGAMLHVAGDLVQSLGVALAGALIWWKQDDPRWALADPICTFLFAVLVLLTTRAILRDISDVLMERVPRAHDSTAVEAALLQVEGVERVQDLHIWGLKPGVALLSAHLIIAGGADPCAALSGATAACAGLGIQHSTLQLAHANGTPCCAPLPPPSAPR